MSWHCPAQAQGKRLYLFRGFHRPLSRGATWRLYGSGRHIVTKLTPAFPHSSHTVLRMAAHGGFVEQRRDMIPRWCQRAGMAGICLRPERPRCFRAFNVPVGGVGAASWACGGGPIRASSEAESCPRVRIALEESGVSLEGASNHRARWSFARGGVQPSSEVEFCREGVQPLSEAEFRPRGASSPRARWSFVSRCRVPRVRWSFARGGVQPSSKVVFRPRGRPALERGGVSPERASSPRARWSFTRGGVQPSSEVEFRCHGVGPLV
jgi:hypothetical protein